uniref:Uncharacterized protein n=1 Tax=Ciona savignyi TaxID=51511 RepID=H2YT71_CIOSA
MSVLFGYPVYIIKNYHWSNDQIVNKRNQTTHCNDVTFKGSDLIDFSHSSPSNNFVCMSIWPNGTAESRPMGSHVICTAGRMAEIAVIAAMKSTSHPNAPIHRNWLLIFGGIVSAAILVLLTAYFIIRAKKKKAKNGKCEGVHGKLIS